MNILIGGAWPYANGPLHIGHIAALLPGDVIARYHRAKGNMVFYVSGSDCHGTPVTIRAQREGKTPEEVSLHYHEEYVRDFEKLGFSYDLYGRTSSEEHRAFVTRFHERLYRSEYICEKTAPQGFCGACGKNLTDRMVTGLCPFCGEKTRGDQCDACGAVLEAGELLSPVCAECGNTPVFRTTKNLYVSLTGLEKKIREFVAAHPNWRKNAIAFSNRYLDDGLRDRAVTRDLVWGIPVPKKGYEDKKIYIWAENVLGYLSASLALCAQRGVAREELWGDGAGIKHYYVHGKDNIPFHTIILPALLLAEGEGWRLPDEIISSEHMTLEGRVISTSKNYGVWVRDIVDRYDPDSLRYFFIVNGPEKRDTDFSWRDYVNRHNGELLGAYGNFVNRTLVFIERFFSSRVPEGRPAPGLISELYALFELSGVKIDAGELKDALSDIFAFVRKANKYYDEKAPWLSREGDPEDCKDTLFTCVQLIANLAVLLCPFLPFSSAKLISALGLEPVWKPQSVPAGLALPKPEILFQRLDKTVAEEEQKKLRAIL